MKSEYSLRGRSEAIYRATLTPDSELLYNIEDLAASAHTAVADVALAALRLLLHFYAGHDGDGITTKVEFDDVLKHTLMRCAVNENESFRDILSAVTASQQQERPDEDLRKSQQADDLDGARDFVLPCAFEYVRVGTEDNISPNQEGERFRLLLRVIHLPKELQFIFRYSGRYRGRYRGDFDTMGTVTRLADTYLHLLERVAASPDRAIRELPLVSDRQRQEVLATFNATAFSAEGVGRDSTIDDLFAACVKEFAHKRAVVDERRSLTYAQLNQRVDALAHYLVAAGLQPGEPVAIQLQPAVEVLVAMLGALRAGGCYLPIDTGMPADRVQSVLDDSGARFVVGDEHASAALAFRGHIIDPDRLNQVTSAPSVPASLPSVSAGDCAYLIYTSGTTGTPKGVLVEHHSLVNYVSWFRHQYGIDSSHKGALLTSPAFDLGYTTMWTTIVSGGEIHFLSESLRRDISALPRYFRDHGISFIKVTPSLLSVLIGANAFNRDNCGSLRLVVTGGEKVRPDDIQTIYARLPEVLVVNHYGPTETTIGVTTHAVQRAEAGAFARRPVIGRPIANTKIYVASPSSLQLLPVGAPGELFIAGRGVSRGYHGRDELTRAKFFANPFEPFGTVYRTGDLARWTEEGTIEFLGRVDRQVKIRGYRVEPSEIEQEMLRRLDMREVAVIDTILGASNQILCAYYVGDSALDPADIRASLSEVLPEYMVPSYFMRVPWLPRSANGKLDVDELPKPSFACGFESNGGAEGPQNDTERTLLRMWSDILGLDAGTIDVAQNFFQLGGHSLLMIQLIAEIDDHFGISVPIPVFFGEGTIRALAKVIDGDDA